MSAALRAMKREGELWCFTRHRRGRWINNLVEIGQSQMTKTDLLARPVRRHHVADLDVAVGDDHAVDQEFDQGPPLLEGVPPAVGGTPDWSLRGQGRGRKLLVPDGGGRPEPVPLDQ